MSDERTGLEPEAADHGRIDELLAAHALGALSEEDLPEAESLFVDHVPGCPRCRGTIEELEGLVGDLALAARPARAPETLWASLRRELRRPLPIVAPRRLRLPTWAAAVATVAVVTLGGLTATMSSRVSQAETQRAGLVDMLGFVGQEGTEVVPASAMETSDGEAHEVRIVVAFRPGQRVIHLFATGLAEGNTYSLWLTRAGAPVVRVETFRADGTQQHVKVRGGFGQYDGFWVTPAAAEPDTATDPSPLVTASV